jgi:phage-related holin
MSLFEVFSRSFLVEMTTVIIIWCVIDYEETLLTEYIIGCVDNQECYIAVCSGYLLVFFAVEIYVLVLRLCPGVSS